MVLYTIEYDYDSTSKENGYYAHRVNSYTDLNKFLRAIKEVDENGYCGNIKTYVSEPEEFTISTKEILELPPECSDKSDKLIYLRRELTSVIEKLTSNTCKHKELWYAVMDELINAVKKIE